MVDETIQWARESLQRRRRELQQTKKNLVESYSADNDENDVDDTHYNSSPTQQQKAVHTILERGRALLAEAEAHSEILGQYASSGSSGFIVENQDSKYTDDSRNHYSSSSKDDFRMRTFRPNSRPLPVEMPAWKDEKFGKGTEEGNDNKYNYRQASEAAGQNYDQNEDLQELLREGEARARLDELIANVRRQGDDALPRRHAGAELLDDDDDDYNDTPTKKISNFDPSSMYAARRAALKKSKLDEEIALKEEEERRLSSFKALPLPGGVEVKNNLFAQTKAFQGKQIGSVEKVVRRDTKYEQQYDNNDATSSVLSTFGGGTFDGSMSMVTSRTSHDNSFNSYSGYENEADRQRAKQLRAEKKMKKRRLLDAVNQTIMSDTNQADDDMRSVFSEGISYDIVEDPSKLRQDIARLEAKLKQKKTQRIAVLNDIVDIDLDALFDRLISSESGDNARYIIDRLKKQVCGKVNDFHKLPQIDRQADLDQTMNDEPQRRSLFRRQEEWARQREQKLFEARIQLEADAMYGITGRPELSHAKRSWAKAKESHDETLKKCAEVEEKKSQEKEAKEKAANELKEKEMEELQKKANSKLKSITSEVNKEEQMKRLEMLSKPRLIREVHQSVKLDVDVDMVVGDQQQSTTSGMNSKSKIFLSSPGNVKPKQKTIHNGGGGGRMKSALADKHDGGVVKNITNLPNGQVAYDKRPDEFCGKSSFSEMSDKEFRSLVRRIERNAMSKVKESQNDSVED